MEHKVKKKKNQNACASKRVFFSIRHGFKLCLSFSILLLLLILCVRIPFQYSFDFPSIIVLKNEMGEKQFDLHFVKSKNEFTSSSSSLINRNKNEKPQLISIIKGNLESRFSQICIAWAYANVANLTVSHVWMQDSIFKKLKFSHLFKDDILKKIKFEFKNENNFDENTYVLNHGYEEKTFSEFHCKDDDNDVLPNLSFYFTEPIPEFKLLVSPNLINDLPMNNSFSCLLEQYIQTCFSQLNVCNKIKKIIKKENIVRVKSSIGVYVQNGKQKLDYSNIGRRKCKGCYGSRTANCTTRKLAMKYLYNPNLDFTLGGQTSSLAMQVWDVFHPNRAPFLPNLTRKRYLVCRGHSRTSVLGSGGSKIRTQIQTQTSNLNLRRLNTMDERREGGKDKDKDKDEDEDKDKDKDEDEDEDEDKDDKIDFEIYCAQLQVAEMVILGMTKSLFFSYRNAITDFIFSKIFLLPKKKNFDHEKSICKSFPISSIMEQKIAYHLIVDERLKTIYCSIPKVACTSFKMFFREQKGYHDYRNTTLAHDSFKNGLDELWTSYDEHRAIRVLTRKDFFKFTFVRNPFDRILSVYLNKHVQGGPPFTREHWNKKFFGRLDMAMYRLDEKEKNSFRSRNNLNRRSFKFNDRFLKFDQFVKYTSAVIKYRKLAVEPHIAPQIDVCNLGNIKYDFVGKFENFKNDVDKILKILNTKSKDSFIIGKSAHPTNSSSKLLKIYTKEAYDLVKGMYGRDLNISHNNIYFSPPEVLSSRFEPT